MKRLVVFGDSITVGFVDERGMDNPIKSFVDYLGEYLGCSVLNRGFAGHSNIAILNDFIYYMENEHRQNDVIFIAWSDQDRTTVYNKVLSEKKNFREPNHLHRFTGSNWSRSPWELYNDDCDDAFEDLHLKRVLNISAYNTVKRLCEKKNVPYRMISGYSNKWLINKLYIIDQTDCFENESPLLDITTHNVHSIVDNDDSNWIERKETYNTLMDICFGNWKSKDIRPSDYFYVNGVRRKNDETDLYYKCLHPTEKGHKLIAKTLLPYLREVIT